MNWKDIWMMLFRTVELFGLNMGFGGGCVDRCRDECGLLVHEAPKERE